MEDELTAQQFMENIKDWEPASDWKNRIEIRLKNQGVSADRAGELADTLNQGAVATFRYLQFIYELATTKELDKRTFLPSLASLVERLQALREAKLEYLVAFRRYDEGARPELKRASFDTLYYDVIQGLDLQEFLKEILKEVAPLLEAMSLTSAELKGAHCVALFEQCIRFHLFLKYFFMKKEFSPEELWSLLFDLFNLFSAEGEGTGGEELQDLEDLKGDLERLKGLN